MAAGRAKLISKVDSMSAVRGAEKAQQDTALRELRAENMAKIATYYNTIKPAKAAEILQQNAELSENDVADIINRLTPAKAGKIMGFMDPEYAARITKIIQNLKQNIP